MTEDTLDMFGPEAAQIRDLLRQIKQRPTNTWLSAARRLNNVACGMAVQLSQSQLKAKLKEFLDEDAIMELLAQTESLSAAAVRLIDIGNFIKRNPSAASVTEADERSGLIIKQKQSVQSCGTQLLASLTDAFLENCSFSNDDLPALMASLRAEVDMVKWAVIVRKIHRAVLYYDTQFMEVLREAKTHKCEVHVCLFGRNNPHYIGFDHASLDLRATADELYTALVKQISALEKLHKRMMELIARCSLLLIVDDDYKKRGQNLAAEDSIKMLDLRARYYTDYRTNILASLGRYLQALEDALSRNAAIKTLAA